MKRDIAVVILNYIQYTNIIPGINKLIELGYKIDFYCNDVDSDDGFKELFSDVRDFIKSKNYNIYMTPQEIEYKVLLEPYPSGININAKYKIRYRYGNITAKPNIVCLPKNYLVYDCILCSGNYDSNYLQVFSNTFITGNQKYINFKKDNKKKYSKKVLLYLPTYGKESSIDIIEDELKVLKKYYYVIAKIHHGTSFLKNEKERINKVKENVDEFYDLHKDLSDLLSIADVVLTDNSGAIFEAIYTEVPVAVFADNINKNKINNFNSIQYELYKNGILPYTNKKEEILNILSKAQNPKIFAKQKKWNKDNLYHPKDLVIDFVKCIEKYLNDDINVRYYEMHKVLQNDYYNLQNEIQLLKKNINNQIAIKDNLELENNRINLVNKQLESVNKDLESKIQEMNTRLDEQSQRIKDLKDDNKVKEEELRFLKKSLKYYETGKLYKMAHSIYNIKNGGKK